MGFRILGGLEAEANGGRLPLSGPSVRLSRRLVGRRRAGHGPFLASMGGRDIQAAAWIECPDLAVGRGTWPRQALPTAGSEHDIRCELGRWSAVVLVGIRTGTDYISDYGYADIHPSPDIRGQDASI